LARAELEAMLLDEFDVEQSVLSQEVDRMLAQLSAEGLIDEREAA
jgi:Coenzyme PQQ synthesis protein D (PqqD)